MSVKATANTQDATLDADFLASVVNQVKQTAELPSGTAIAVIKDDKVIYQGNFGYSNIETLTAVDANSLFYIASVTKPFTALNFLLDASENQVSGSTTMKTMFPDFGLNERYEVTVKQLLTHTASINNLPLVLATAYSGEHNLASRNALVLRESSADEHAPGTFDYSNVGYNIYSVYADQHFDTPWQRKLHQQVFTPAGMQHTTAEASTVKDTTRIAKPYSLTHHPRSQALYLQKDDSIMHAAGGMYSTSTDLSRFVIAQLNAGKIDGEQVYPADIIEASQVKQVSTSKQYLDFSRDGYAWGWYTGNYKGHRMLHHFGGFAGAHAHVSFIPEQRIGLVVLNNEDMLSSQLTNIIADYVYGALLHEGDVKNKVTKKVKALQEKLAGLNSNLTAQRTKIAKRKWILSLPHDAYIGEYTHPTVGSIKVTSNDEKRFTVSWGKLRSAATGMDTEDKIRVQLDPTSGSVLSFDVSEHVNALSYAGLTFVKEN